MWLSRSVPSAFLMSRTVPICWPFCVRSFTITLLTPGRVGSPAVVTYATISENRPVARFSAMRFSVQRRSNSSAGITGMANLLPIKSIRRKHLQDAVRQALRSGLNVDVLEDFLASVDWSGTDRHRPKIAEDIGRLEGLNAEYSEGQLTESQHIARLLGFLPEEERNRHLFLDGGPVRITVVLRPIAAGRPVARVDQSAGRPQTGSGAPPHLAIGASRSGSVL